jgi:small subunit ribosomal protein S20
MANIKSAKKRVKISEVKRKRNVARISDIKTAVKKFLDAVEEKNLNSAKDLLREAKSKIARAAGKGVIKKRTASRKVSRLEKKLTVVKQ